MELKKKRKKKKKKVFFGIFVGILVIGGIFFMIKSNSQKSVLETFPSQSAIAKIPKVYFNTTSPTNVKTKVHDIGINISKWNGEIEFYIELPQVVNTEDLGNDTLRVYHGQYEGIFYMGNENEFEWEIILGSKPGANCWSFPYQSKNLDFWYQPALTQEELDAGDFRPERVVGSYAVYHNSKSNNEYTTGKAFHIYRPFFNSSKGSGWLDLNLSNNLFEICGFDNIPAGAKDIIIDPTFGFSGVGDSDSGNNADQMWGLGPHDMPEAGDATSVSIYSVGISGDSFTLGIYDNDAGGPNNLEADTAGGNGGADGWQTQNLDSSTTLVDGNTYWIGYNSDTGQTQKFDAVGGYSRYYVNGASHTEGTLVDPFYSSTTETTTRKYSAFITYTATGGGGVDSCNYTSGDGNWQVACSDNCLINNVTNLEGNNLILNNSGTFHINATISNVSQVQKINSCVVYQSTPNLLQVNV